MKISVIIPVFNAEKYLDMCLESILIQTLQDFEVIFVDDCSTDSSATIAESYLEKFGGRLKIITLAKNSGSGAFPRNVGLEYSRGKYVFFMDNDDLLMPNALAELHDFAEKFSTDVVYMERGFLLDGENIKEARWDKKISSPEEPTLETENPIERLENLLRTNYGWAPWTKFLRRDFLIAEKINFPHVKISEDVLWTFKLVFLSKNFLRVPNRLYICRSVKNSLSRVERKPQDEIKFWLDPLIRGADYLDKFIRENKFFEQNPKYHFEVTNFFVKMQVAGMLGAFEKLNHDELYEIFYGEFSKDDAKHAALISNLLVFVNFYRSKSLEVK